ncbi:DUF4250 domain-containing protein [Alginatibacterium sediminis]|uniref:DUF4250 domain-containing protein n=1 Tax=Alginatibacterium sediminis TaxID=2164068 RepID=A0A420E6K6_9ALTE|nr:DUF4250 domain-containing protein [Alginatibacterium sediminis]RKF14247.1 DUF4250 domain-containing protein [Alginatibacterium sediminis]
MDAGNLLRLDPNIVLGIVNEKLRLECFSLDELTSMFGIQDRQLETKLELIGYRYDVISNQFKAY